MKTRAAAYIVYGQASFAFFIGVCVALHPGLVLKGNEGGLSNYGIHLKTVVPYTLALGLASAFSGRAAVLVRRTKSAPGLAQVLAVYGGLALVVLVSTYPYSLNVVFKDAHIALGAAMMIFDLATSVWMFRVLGHRPGDGFVLGVESVGFVLAVLTFAGSLHLLFLSQVLTGGSFAILLVRTGHALTSRTPTPPAGSRLT